MPRSKVLSCSGIFILSTIAINAQDLPKNPTQQQVIGYRLQDQKQWQLKQLPKNSVLYQYNSRFTGASSLTFSFKKERPRELNLTTVNKPVLSLQPGTNIPGTPSVSSLQNQLLRHRQLYNEWRRQGWWKDPAKGEGSLWLREFLNHSKSRNNFRL